jgi:Putative zinc-finger
METGGPKAVNIRCEEVWREISNYLEDEVSAGLRTRMDEHFKGCRRCTAVLVGTRNVVRLVGDAAVFDLLTAVSDCTDQKPGH